MSPLWLIANGEKMLLSVIFRCHHYDFNHVRLEITDGPVWHAIVITNQLVGVSPLLINKLIEKWHLPLLLA